MRRKFKIGDIVKHDFAGKEKGMVISVNECALGVLWTDGNVGYWDTKCCKKTGERCPKFAASATALL